MRVGTQVGIKYQFEWHYLEMPAEVRLERPKRMHTFGNSKRQPAIVPITPSDFASCTNKRARTSRLTAADATGRQLCTSCQPKQQRWYMCWKRPQPLKTVGSSMTWSMSGRGADEKGV